MLEAVWGSVHKAYTENREQPGLAQAFCTPPALRGRSAGAASPGAAGQAGSPATAKGQAGLTYPPLFAGTPTKRTTGKQYVPTPVLHPNILQDEDMELEETPQVGTQRASP